MNHVFFFSCHRVTWDRRAPWVLQGQKVKRYIPTFDCYALKCILIVSNELWGPVMVTLLNIVKLSCSSLSVRAQSIFLIALEL